MTIHHPVMGIYQYDNVQRQDSLQYCEVNRRVMMDVFKRDPQRAGSTAECRVETRSLKKP